MKEHSDVGFRIMAKILILVMVITYMPLFGSAVYAEENDIETKVEKLPDGEVKAEKEKALAEVKEEVGVDDSAEEDDEVKEVKLVGGIEDKKAGTTDLKKGTTLKEAVKGLKLSSNTLQEDKIITVTGPDSNGIIKLSGAPLPSDYTYESVYLGDEHSNVAEGQNVRYLGDLGGTSFNCSIDMKNYPVGYHTIYVTVRKGDEDPRYYSDTVVNYVPTYIYGKPSNNINWYTTGKKYFTLYYNGSNYSRDTSCGVFVMYKKGKGRWTKKSYGPISTDSYKRSKRGGCKVNQTIKARLVYGKKFDYNNTAYAFTGRLTNKKSKTVTVRTAYNKPKFKSIKISKAKVIKHTYRVHYANRIRYIKSTGRIISITPLYHTYRYYYTKFKVTVKFKKKQKIAGVDIKTLRLTATKKGNKKKYSATYTVSGKKKGKKVKVFVRCWRSNKYGGYSSWRSKKVKVRR